MKKYKHIKWKLLKNGKGIPVVFIPGGPGIDPSYGKGLIDVLELEGPIWGAQFKVRHQTKKSLIDYWNKEIFIKLSKLNSPIVIAHSAGAMMTLLNSELPKLRLNSILLLNNPIDNSYLKDLAQTSKKLRPYLDKLNLEANEVAFSKTPNSTTLSRLWESWTPFYFATSKIKKGRMYLKNLNVDPNVFKMGSIALNKHKKYCRWETHSVPTIWLLGAKDNIVLSSVAIKKNRVLTRKCLNYEVVVLKQGGHFPWIDSPKEMKYLLNRFFINA